MELKATCVIFNLVFISYNSVKLFCNCTRLSVVFVFVVKLFVYVFSAIAIVNCLFHVCFMFDWKNWGVIHECICLFIEFLVADCLFVCLSFVCLYGA